MRRIDCGISGEPPPADTVGWSDLGLDPVWLSVIDCLAPDTRPRPVQVEALGKLGVLAGRRNLIVSAPTNSGKSLVGLLILLDAVRRGRRGVLLEPLRAVAREKWDELQAARPALEKALGYRLRVLISTGDYRLEAEHFSDPLPEQGELLIATPERLDAVLRNPARDGWFATLGAVVVDEAHLISTPGRGATLEYLVTSLLCLPSPPRIALLSATMGDSTAVSRWLDPCDVATCTVRVPPLRREVWELDEEDADEAVSRYAQQALAEKDTGVLVFVYQTRSAEALAERLRPVLGERAGPAGPLAYHAQLPQTRREEVRRSFLAGECRLVVTTTALALGVNLPATHVCVRDILFPGTGYLPVGDLLQMMGRAGRSDRPGHAVVLVRGREGISVEELASAIRDESLPELRSSLDLVGTRRSRANEEEPEVSCAPTVLARLVRHPEGGVSGPELRDFFARSLGGRGIAGSLLGDALDWLTDPRRVLAWQDEQHRFRPTVLGLRAARAVLPLEVAGGVGRLIRDLLTLDEEDEVLGAWQPLDFLLVLELTHPHAGLGVRFSERLAAQLDAWLKGQPAGGSRLYRGWLAGPSGQSRAHQLLGSLGLGGEERLTPEGARKAAYLALLRGVVLGERGNGVSEADLAERWGLVNLAGVEERWRDDHLWLLSGVREVLEVRCFYYHLKEACRTAPERLRRVERVLRRLRSLTFDLQGQLAYCSPLGPALRSLRRTARQGEGATVGVATIRKLEGAGIRDLVTLARCSAEDLGRLGVRQPWASQLLEYARRRLQ
jgi:superfamily II DNA/RNA helicase